MPSRTRTSTTWASTAPACHLNMDDTAMRTGVRGSAGVGGQPSATASGPTSSVARQETAPNSPTSTSELRQPQRLLADVKGPWRAPTAAIGARGCAPHCLLGVRACQGVRELRGLEEVEWPRIVRAHSDDHHAKRPALFRRGLERVAPKGREIGPGRDPQRQAPQLLADEMCGPRHNPCPGSGSLPAFWLTARPSHSSV